ncbi:hypothetical protein Btru_028331 [Bulinus truncatus]|nr:hypothetical protein Btru_028331 [Bulinus truncatus]
MFCFVFKIISSTGSEVIGQWSEWTNCTATSCGWGKRSRQRKVPTSCPDFSSSQSEDCFTKSCDCPGDMVWSNHSNCQRTCQTEPEPGCRLQVYGGCVCPKHLVLDGNRCVPLENCSLDCVYNNKTFQVGETFPCGKCKNCLCLRGRVQQSNKVCPDVSGCNMTTHQLVKSKDSCCLVDCVPKDKCHKMTLPTSLITIDNCTSTVAVKQEMCQGECPSSEMYVDYIKKTLVQGHCRCCSAIVNHFVPVEFKCQDSFVLTHRLPVIESCFCQKCFISPSDFLIKH